MRGSLETVGEYEQRGGYPEPVLIKGGQEVSKGVACELYRSHFRICAPGEWIRRIGNGMWQKGVVLMLWIMCCPKGLVR